LVNTANRKIMVENNSTLPEDHLQDYTHLFTQNVCNTISDMTGIALFSDQGSYSEQSFKFNHGMIVYLNFYGKVQGEFIIGVSMKDAFSIMGMEGVYEEQCLDLIREEVSGFFKEVLNIASAQTIVDVEKRYENLTYFPPVVVFGDIFFPEVRSASVLAGSGEQSIKCGFSLNMVRPKIVEKLERIQKSLEKSEKLASTDALTKLYNRTFFESMFNVYIDETRSSNQHLSILLMDIDHFKSVNDTYGHLIGDQVIKTVALAIRNSLRNTDIAVRYGGDEILVVLTVTGIDEAVEIAEKIRNAVKKLVIFTTADETKITVSLSVSIGCTELTELDEPVTLFERADSYLYKAKESGRDQVISDKDKVESGSRFDGHF
jgi:diguanylate cyclase (GGDEF)-like protein